MLDGGVIEVYLQQPDGSIVLQDQYTTVSNAWQVEYVDINNDGVRDAISPSISTTGIGVLYGK